MPESKLADQQLEKRITELEKGLFDSENNKSVEFQTLFDSMTEMLQVLELIYDEHGRPVDFYIRDTNLSFTKMVGKSKSQLINKKSSEIFSVIEDSWLTSLASVDKTGLAISFENYGAEFDKYYFVNAWKISNKRVGVSYTDISDRKRREKEKSATKLAFSLIKNDLDEAQKLAKIGSWLFDPTTNEAEWSDEMFRIWGFDPSKGTPEYVSILKRIHLDDLEYYQNCVANASIQGAPYDIEFRIQTANGEQKVIRAICQATSGTSIKLRNLNGTNQDVTSQKQFEEDLVKHQRLNAIGEMSSSIAHDFNNALQEMMGNLDIIRVQNDLSVSTLERVNNIGSIISDTAGRVAALQQFGDTEHKNKQAELIDLNAMIEESVQQARPLWKDNIERKGLKIGIETDFECVPKINGNRGELKSIFYNLIKNSVEAMPEGGEINIKTSTNAEYVYICFTDNGDGMAAETKLKVFQPYYSTKGLELGRGLGMSGAYGIVKKHKGDIVVKFSELAKGTTIEITLPIQPTQQNVSKSISREEETSKDSLAILWVDDDRGIREGASDLLEFMGHHCETASSGENALQALSNKTFDVVFTDIGMPEMNGWELADSIRNEFGNAIKIIVVSGWDIEEKAKEQCYIDSTLQKPFDMKQLKEKLMLI